MSAFLAVLLSAILLFQNTLCFLTGYVGEKGTLEQLLRQSAYSVLADFDGSVKDKYGLYMLYQDGTNTKDTLSVCLRENLEYEATYGMSDIALRELTVAQDGFSRLSNLEQQILAYCKYRIPLAGLQEFFDRAGVFFDFLQSDEKAFPLQAIDPTELYDAEKEYDTKYYENFDMRQASEECFNSLQNREDGVTIPYDLFSKLPSQRLTAGDGWNWQSALDTFENLDLEQENAVDIAEGCINDLTFSDLGKALYEDYLINEYILSVFNSRTQSNQTDSYLQGEAEYILFGNREDSSNTAYMRLLVLLLRFVLNTAFIYQQEDMVTVADIAAYLATVWAYFEGQPVVKQGMLLAWSFMESWHDCDLLLAGKKVPVYKTKDSWHYWISFREEGKEKEVSLYYKDYLRIFLLMVPRQVRLARILDLIQLNESRYNSSFQILQSVTVLRVNLICTYDKKRKWELTAEGVYGYEAIA